MSREEYRNLWKNVEPRKKHQEELMEKLTNKEDEVFTMDQKKNRKPLYGTVAAFALLALILAGNSLMGKNPGGEPGTVKYSDLLFEEPVLVEAPEPMEGQSGKIMPFTEELLTESAAFIKGTVTEIAFESDKVIYTVLVSKVYGPSEGVEEGKSITITNDLYTYTSLAGSVEKLQVDRTYLIPLTLREEEGKEVYSVLYPFAPQIQMTKDGQYLYPDHYTSLDTEEAKVVEMDTEEGYGYYGTMKLREDDSFEKDLEKLAETYLGQ
ncbi:hypothetical protein [Proteiniclasticum ruminis]|uniref:Uncharacterized protein n=1 Tax=Proteiniclasticum ruminis TaxID=398199 RepID=A0A1G8LJX0_9CLOT|nr:hypothetical protein [Proteiniclasticum ruminis]SDI55966.1 hypothetical protein SAMN05421804_103101 [Proteiniclasticum ruminis]